MAALSVTLEALRWLVERTSWTRAGLLIQLEGRISIG